MSKHISPCAPAQRWEITAPLPLGACIQAVEQALKEMNSGFKRESFDRRRITAHTYKSVVGFAQEKLHLTIADMGENECLVQMISEPAYQPPPVISDLSADSRNIEAFKAAFERFVPTLSN